MVEIIYYKNTEKVDKIRSQKLDSDIVPMIEVPKIGDWIRLPFDDDRESGTDWIVVNRRFDLLRGQYSDEKIILYLEKRKQNED